MSFGDTLPTISYEFRAMNLRFTNLAMSDSLGDLLFSTNGIYIADQNNDPMENGHNINPGPFADEFRDLGYNLPHGMVAMPLPNSEDSLFYLFHVRVDFDDDWGTRATDLLYTVINVKANNGLGMVVEKNVPIIVDTLAHAQLTAVRHANGRDWWIIQPKSSSNCYYKILFTDKGVEDVQLQCLGWSHLWQDWSGQGVFSPDGATYVRYDVLNDVSIFDFDRCNGELSNDQRIRVIDFAVAGGAAISPNSQFLYISSYDSLYQYDLYANDIKESRVTVAKRDTFTDEFGFPARFYLMQLGPDGRIYCNSTTAIHYLHVIDNPDEKGLASNVQNRGIYLPTRNAFTMPHYPNYRLGPLEGSPCDTLSTLVDIAVRPENYFTVSPNPARSEVRITLGIQLSDWSELHFELGRVDGTVISQFDVPNTSFTEDLSIVTNGIYFLRLLDHRRRLIQVEKLVINH